MHISIADIVFFLLMPFGVLLILSVHEMAHYLAARLFKMDVPDVQIGFGPTLFGFKSKSGTRWSFHLVPLYAYVEIAGMDETVSDEKGFAALPLWKRLTVILAGPLSNLILPFILLAGFYVTAGQPIRPPVITAVEIGHAADKAGLKYGDEVIAIDGSPVRRYRDIARIVYTGVEDQAGHDFLIRRQGQTDNITINVTPEWITYTDIEGIERAHRRLGVIWRHRPFDIEVLETINGEDVKENTEEAIALLKANMESEIIGGFKSTDDTTRFYRFYLHAKPHQHLGEPHHEHEEHFYTGPEIDNRYMNLPLRHDLGDAFAITTNLIGKIAMVPFQLFPVDPELREDFVRIENPAYWWTNIVNKLVFMTGMLSIAVALINLLPLPRLDGGYILVAILEALKSRPLSPREKAYLFAGGFLVFYAAVFIANARDIPFYVDSRIEKAKNFIED